MSKGCQLIGLGLTMWAVALGPAWGQEEAAPAPREVKIFEVPRASTEINIDGVLDEPAWQDAAVIPLIYEYFPGNNIEPPVETEVTITFFIVMIKYSRGFLPALRTVSLAAG